MLPLSAHVLSYRRTLRRRNSLYHLPLDGRLLLHHHLPLLFSVSLRFDLLPLLRHLGLCGSSLLSSLIPGLLKLS